MSTNDTIEARRAAAMWEARYREVEQMREQDAAVLKALRSEVERLRAPAPGGADREAELDRIAAAQRERMGATTQADVTPPTLLEAAIAWHEAQGWDERPLQGTGPATYDLVMAIRAERERVAEADDPVLRAMRDAPIVEGDAAEQAAEAVGLRSIDARDIIPEDQRAMIRVLPGEHDPRGIGVGAHDMPDGGPCSCGAWHTRRMDIPGIYDEALDAALRNACGHLADVRAGRRVSNELLSLSQALLAVYAELEGRTRQ